jgi:ERF superfamily
MMDTIEQPTRALSVQAPEDERLEHAIIRAAQDDGIDIAKLQALLDMQRSVQRERSVRAFNTAMAAAQSEMEQIPRDAVNTHTKSRYARMETIDRLMRPIYTKHGFSLRFGSQPSPREGWMRIVCTVAHTGGHFEENHLDAPPDDVGVRGAATKTGIQSVGSSVTYLRRYLTTMVFNIVLSDEVEPDTDGEPTRRQSTREADASHDPLAPLREPNGTTWLRNLARLLDAAQSTNDVVAIAGHVSVRGALDPNGEKRAPSLIRERINDLLRKAHERLAPADTSAPADATQEQQTWDTDPIAALLDEIAGMDLETVSEVQDNAAWRAKVRDAASFPPDQDRISEAIEARRIALKAQGGKA